jgi:hypothetical protein
MALGMGSCKLSQERITLSQLPFSISCLVMDAGCGMGGGGGLVRNLGQRSGTGWGKAHLNISRFSTELRDTCKVSLGEHFGGEGVYVFDILNWFKLLILE